MQVERRIKLDKVIGKSLQVYASLSWLGTRFISSVVLNWPVRNKSVPGPSTSTEQPGATKISSIQVDLSHGKVMLVLYLDMGTEKAVFS